MKVLYCKLVGEIIRNSQQTQTSAQEPAPRHWYIHDDALLSHCWQSSELRMLHAGPWVCVHNYRLGAFCVAGL